MIGLNDSEAGTVGINPSAPVKISFFRSISHQIHEFDPFDGIVSGNKLDVLCIVPLAEHILYAPGIIIETVIPAPVLHKFLNGAFKGTGFKKMIPKQRHTVDPFRKTGGFHKPHTVPHGIFDICLLTGDDTFLFEGRDFLEYLIVNRISLQIQVTFIQSTLPGFFRGGLVHAAFEALVILGFDNVGHSREEAVLILQNQNVFCRDEKCIQDCACRERDIGGQLHNFGIFHGHFFVEAHGQPVICGVIQFFIQEHDLAQLGF